MMIYGMRMIGGSRYAPESPEEWREFERQAARSRSDIAATLELLEAMRRDAPPKKARDRARPAPTTAATPAEPAPAAPLTLTPEEIAIAQAMGIDSPAHRERLLTEKKRAELDAIAARIDAIALNYGR